MVNEMIEEFARQGRSVVIFEYDVGPPGEPAPDMGGRKARWYEARGGGKGATLPLVMAQGGLLVTEGHHWDYRKVYQEMIEAAAKAPPTAAVEAFYQETSEGTLLVEIFAKNTGSFPLDPSTNQAAVRLFAFEEAQDVHINRSARAVDLLPLEKPLAPGEQIKLSHQLRIEKSFHPARLSLLVVVEYKNPQGRWDIAQGALAQRRSTVSLAARLESSDD